MRSRRRHAVSLYGALLLASAGVCGCHTAKLLVPPPPLRGASAATFAIDIEFAEPLYRPSAQDPARYLVYPTGNAAAPATVVQATLIDTLFGRVVQLLVSDPVLGPLPDSADYTVQTSGVLTVEGKSTGVRSIDIHTGLNYDAPLRDLFARHCDSCHGPALAAGSYRTDSYLGLFGAGISAIPNVIPGNPNCLLVVKTKPQNSMFRLGGLSYFDFELIRNWVVSYQARQ